MELKRLEKKRNSYAEKIVKLGFLIAVIFLLPVIIAVILSRTLQISFLYFFPVAFITSWFFVFLLYRKYSKEIYELDKNIALQKEKSLNK